MKNYNWDYDKDSISLEEKTEQLLNEGYDIVQIIPTFYHTTFHQGYDVGSMKVVKSMIIFSEKISGR